MADGCARCGGRDRGRARFGRFGPRLESARRFATPVAGGNEITIRGSGSGACGPGRQRSVPALSHGPASFRAWTGAGVAGRRVNRRSGAVFESFTRGRFAPASGNGRDLRCHHGPLRASCCLLCDPRSDRCPHPGRRGIRGFGRRPSIPIGGVCRRGGLHFPGFGLACSAAPNPRAPPADMSRTNILQGGKHCFPGVAPALPPLALDPGEQTRNIVTGHEVPVSVQRNAHLAQQHQQLPRRDLQILRKLEHAHSNLDFPSGWTSSPGSRSWCTRHRYATDSLAGPLPGKASTSPSSSPSITVNSSINATI